MSTPRTPEDLDAQFNLRARHPDFQSYFNRNESLSRITRQRFAWNTDVAYGQHALQRLDVAPAGERESPVFLFIHGGYWKSLDKRSHLFLARPFLESGCAAVNVNYRLAPEIGIEPIVKDVIEAIRWTRNHAREFNGDRDCIYIAGHSAGAHLALASAVALATTGDPAGPAIKGILGVSGLYNLEPVQRSYLNEELGFSASESRDWSPLLRKDLPGFARLQFNAGSEETDVFISQTQEIHSMAIDSGRDSRLELIRGCHHFDILYELGNAGGRLAKDFLELIEKDRTAKRGS